MKTLLAYIDTSVYGGVFDEEFADASGAFFSSVRIGRFALLVSDITRREIDAAPKQVRELFDGLLQFMRFVIIDEEVLALRDAYVSTGIVSPKWIDDAAHVAAATIAAADLIVSWNFRHIVHFEKIRLYNAVNALHGYREIEIRSPLEVIEYEGEDF